MARHHFQFALILVGLLSCLSPALGQGGTGGTFIPQSYANVTTGGPVSSNFLLSASLGTATLTRRPLMGWDSYYASWNGSNERLGGQTSVLCGVTESFVLFEATNFLNDGLLALGYNWICISDGWQARDGSGNLIADPTKFPSGMPAVIKKLHQMGFKVRLYDEVGLNYVSCCGFTQSGGTNTVRDAVTLTGWGVDGLTVDNCNDTSSDDTKRYEHEFFKYCLLSNNAAIDYDLHVGPVGANAYTGGFQPWMASGNSWQWTVEWGFYVTADGNTYWPDLLSHIDLAAQTVGYMHYGQTPNLLILNGDYSRFNYNYGRCMMTFWAMFQSPLIWNMDAIQNPGGNFAQFQTNRYIIAIDQDQQFYPPFLAFTNGGNVQGWTKVLQDGSVALAVLNRSTNSNESLTVLPQWLGISSNGVANVFDVWNFTNFYTTSSMNFTSPAASCSLWIVGQRPQMVRNTNGVLISQAPNVWDAQSVLDLEDPVNVAQLTFGNGSSGGANRYGLGRSTADGFAWLNGTQSGFTGTKLAYNGTPYLTASPAGFSVAAGITTKANNLAALLSSNVPAAGTYLWTNTLGSNLFLYLFGGTCSGVGINGSQIAATSSNGVTAALQPGEWMGISNLSAAPVLKFKPF